MADFKQCEFFLVRYVPDVVKGEFVNLGVALLEEGENGFTDVRFLRDWRRVRGLDPEADIELLESYEGELRRLLQSRSAEVINYRGPMSRREWLLAQMRESFSGALEITPMTAVLTESPQAEIGKLAQTYLESSRRAQRHQSGRMVIYNAMREAFEKTGVWQSPAMRKDIAVAQYTRAGDPLKIDCGYRPNGVIHLFHALSLATDVDSAKVLAFSYAELAVGLMEQEHAKSDLTVITEDGLDVQDERVLFALATLRENEEISVAALSQMGAIAEQARADLKAVNCDIVRDIIQMRYVLDTDVVVAAFRSAAGASRQLLLAALDRRFELLLSVPLVLEYEAVLTRPVQLIAMDGSRSEVLALLDEIVAVATPVQFSFRWRPALPDQEDDMVLETALNGAADAIVTFNMSDFMTVPDQFRCAVLSPAQALERVRKQQQ